MSKVAACLGKHKFDSFALANDVASRHRKQGKSGMAPYRCKHCKKYHLGHPKGK